jgi:hypothetical protein
VQAYAQGLDAVRVAANLPSALYVTAPPGDKGRLFIVRQTGQIHILNLATGKLNATLFLNINSRLLITDEQGLLGMAFDPGYASNGKFTMGDAVLADFASPLNALRCAVEMRTALAEDAGTEMQMRFGLHLADVIESGEDCFLSA